MTRVFHIVGEQGSGKSSLIWMMAATFTARGLKCAGVDASQEARAQVRAESGADIMFLEYLPGEAVDAVPGDQLIVIETVQAAPVVEVSTQGPDHHSV